MVLDLLGRLLRRGATASTLESVGRVRVADAVDGEPVKLVGEVRLGFEALTAPLSARRCAAFDVVVEARRSSREGRGGGNWRTVAFYQACRPFEVADESGVAFVQVAQEEPGLRLTHDHDLGSRPFERVDARLADFLAGHGVGLGRGLGYSTLVRASEAALEEGGRVAVLGLARWEASPVSTDGKGDYRSTPRRLVIYPLAGGRLSIGDDPAALG